MTAPEGSRLLNKAPKQCYVLARVGEERIWDHSSAALDTLEPLIPFGSNAMIIDTSCHGESRLGISCRLDIPSIRKGTHRGPSCSASGPDPIWTADHSDLHELPASYAPNSYAPNSASQLHLDDDRGYWGLEDRNSGHPDVA